MDSFEKYKTVRHLKKYPPKGSKTGSGIHRPLDMREEFVWSGLGPIGFGPWLPGLNINWLFSTRTTACNMFWYLENGLAI